MATVNVVLKTSTEGDGLSKAVADLRGLMTEAQKGIQVPDVTASVREAVEKVTSTVEPQVDVFTRATEDMAMGLVGAAIKIDDTYAGIGKAARETMEKVSTDVKTRSEEINTKVGKAFQELGEKVKQTPLFKAIIDLGQSIYGLGANIVRGFITAGTAVGNGIKRIIDIVGGGVGWITDKARALFDGIARVVGPILGPVGTFVGNAIMNTAAVIYSVGEKAISAARFVSEKIGAAFTATVSFIQKARDGISLVIQGVSTVLSAVFAPLVALKNRIVSVFTGVTTWVGNAFNNVKERINGVVEKIKGTWNKITAPVAAKVKEIGEKFKAIKESVASALGPVGNVIKTAFSPVSAIANGAFNIITKAAQGALKTVQDFATGTKNAFDNTAKAAQDLATGALNKVTNATQKAFQEGWNYNNTVEQASAKLNAFTKDGEETAKILEMVQRRAAKTPFEFQEMATAASSLAPLAKSSGMALEDLIQQAEILAASSPEQGLIGATFALREALSGDWVSIQDRFNLSRNTIKQLKKEGLPAMEIISKAMAEMGYDYELVAEMAATWNGRMSTFNDTWTMLKGTLVEPIFEYASEGLGEINAILEEFAPQINSVTKAIAGFFQGILDFIGSPKELLDKLKPLGAFLQDNLIPILSGVAAILSYGLVLAMKASVAAALPLIATFAPVAVMFAGIALAGMAVSRAMEGVFEEFGKGKSIGASIGMASRTVALNLQEMADGATKFLDDFSAKLRSGEPMIRNAFIDSVFKQAQEIFDVIKASIGTWITRWIPELLPKLKDLRVAFSFAFQGLVRAVASYLDQLGNDIVNFVLALVPKVITVTSGLVKALSGWIMDSLPLIISDLLEVGLSIIRWISGFLPSLTAGAGKLLNAMIDWVAELANGVIFGFEWLIERIVKVINGAGPWLKTAFDQWIPVAWTWIQIAGRNLIVSLLAVVGNLGTSIASSAATLANAFMTWAKGFYEWIMVAAPIAWANLVSFVQSLIVIIQDALPGFTTTLAAWASAAWGWIMEAVPMALNALSTMIIGILGYLAENLPIFWTKLMEWAAALIGWVASGIPGLLSGLGEFLAVLLGWLIGGIPSLLSVMAKFAMGMIGWIGDVIPKMFNALAMWLGELIGWLFFKAIPSLTKSNEQTGKSFTQWLVDIIPQIPGLVFNFFKALIEAVGGLIGWVIETALGIGSAFMQGVTNGITGSEEEVEVELTSYGRMIPGSVEAGMLVGTAGVSNAAAGVTTAAVTAIKSEFDVYKDDMTRVGQEHIESVARGMRLEEYQVRAIAWAISQGNVDEVSKNLGLGAEQVKAVAEKLAQAVSNGLTDGLNSGSIDVQEAAFLAGTEFVNPVIAGVESTQQMAVAAGMTTATSIHNGLFGLMREYKDEAQQAGINHVTAIANGLNMERPIVEAVVHGLARGTIEKTMETLGLGYEEVRLIAAELGNRVGDGATEGIEASRENAVDAARRLGTDMTSGVSSGIEEKIPAVINAARDMANQAVQAARTQIQAASPSRLFKREVGAMIPAGMALGIIEGTDGAVKAAVRMVEAVHGATKEAMRKTGVGQIEVIGRPGSLTASGQMGYQGGSSRGVTSTTVVRNQNITYAPSYTTTPNPNVDLTLARSLAGVNS